MSDINITIPGGTSKRLLTKGKRCEDDIVVTAGVSGDGIPYEGDYVITPSIGEKTMATKNKVMKDNVTILAIPFYNVSNQSGGTTAYIGSEV